MKVAALFVDPKGPYFGRTDVDPWDESRDARLYAGPRPVVAHPPCQLWTNMAGVNYVRYFKNREGDESNAHNRPGNDGGCFSSALESVIRWGGVLEHPSSSYAWNTFGLIKPSRHCGEWTETNRPGEWVCEVFQSAYGHPARKRTWLYFVGMCPPFDLNWSNEPGTHQVGWFDRNKPTLGKREASATPPAFAEVLIRLAQHSRSA